MATGLGTRNHDLADAPRPVEQLIRGETPDEPLILVAIQVDHTMRVVEAIAGVLLSCAHACRDEEAADPEAKPLPDFVNAAFARLDNAMLGESA
jgi:hypothetical protein